MNSKLKKKKLCRLKHTHTLRHTHAHTELDLADSPLFTVLEDASTSSSSEIFLFLEL